MPRYYYYSFSALLFAATAACVPQGKYDKLAQDALRLETDLHRSQEHLQVNDSEVARLRAGVAEAEIIAHDRDKRLADALAVSGSLQAKLDGRLPRTLSFARSCIGSARMPTNF